LIQNPEPTVSLDESFLDKFRVDHKDFESLMENWFVDEEWMVKKGEIYIPAHYLKDPYIILNAMICRLYGEETNTHFRMEWFLMAYTIVKTRKAFNWANILSFNISTRAQEAKGMKNLGFYMTTYLIDAVCVAHVFPAFNWAWNPRKPPIHEYFSQLWEVNFKNYFYDICDYFLAPCTKPYLGFTLTEYLLEPSNIYKR
jgi:hypothetical protein